MPARCSAGEAFHFHLEPAGHLEVYLGRPCQYLEPDHLARGEPSLWSSHRYGPRVLDAYRSVLAELRRRGRIHPRLTRPQGSESTLALRPGGVTRTVLALGDGPGSAKRLAV